MRKGGGAGLPAGPAATLARRDDLIGDPPHVGRTLPANHSGDGRERAGYTGGAGPAD
jgi:hypothetical protein